MRILFPVFFFLALQTRSDVLIFTKHTHRRTQRKRGRKVPLSRWKSLCIDESHTALLKLDENNNSSSSSKSVFDLRFCTETFYASFPLIVDCGIVQLRNHVIIHEESFKHSIHSVDCREILVYHLTYINFHQSHFPWNFAVRGEPSRSVAQDEMTWRNFTSLTDF